jgi:pilus assembly protein CpaF
VDLNKVKNFLAGSLMKVLDGSEKLSLEQRRPVVYQQLSQIYTRTGLQLTDEVREKLFQEVLDELSGYGPIQPLLDDADVTEIMVNGPNNVYIERMGKVTKTEVAFENNEHILRIIDRIVTPLGRRIDADHPTVDARLPDGSRVNAVIPPVAIDGPSITIRKFSRERLTVSQLVAYGSLTDSTAEFLRACVAARLNILISGGTGSGKTTLLNVLSGFIPEEDRIVTIEDSAELQLQQDHVVRLETKSPNTDGTGGVTIRDLVRNSLRMRPERIVVGEVRGGEALDMLQAMNTGHDGSLTTLHANAPRDAISRLETMSLMAGIELPIRVIREQIASAVDLIVQQSRLRDGSRKVTQITEVAGMEGDTIVLTDIFKFEQTSAGTEGKILGELKPTGIRPLFSPRLEAAGFKLRPEVFGVNIAEMLAQSRRPTRGR